MLRCVDDHALVKRVLTQQSTSLFPSYTSPVERIMSSFFLQDREEPRLAEGISCSRFCHARLSGPRTAEIRPRHILQKLRDLGHGLVSRCHLEQENITRKGLANCAQGMSTACFLLHCCSDNPDISSHSSVSYKTNRQAQN